MSLRGLNIGRMDILLTFEIPTTSKDSNGGDVTTWATFKTCYAERMIGPGREGLQSNQQVSVSPNDYKIRYDPTITPLMRVFEGVDVGTNQRFYLRDAQHYKREGFSTISAEGRDNV